MRSKWPIVFLLIILIITIIIGIILLTFSFLPFELIKTKIDVFAKDKAADTFTLIIFLRLRYIGIIITITGLILAASIKRIQKFISNLFNSFISFFEEVGQVFLKGFEKKENKVHFYTIMALMVIGISIRLYFIGQPIRYDEAVTVIDYVRKPIFLGISDYHFTNNHIFHSFLSHIAYSWFGDHLWAVRLPAFIFGILLIPITYLVTRMYYSKHAAILSAGIIASSSILIEYSTLARGYSMICFFFIAALALAKYLKDNKNIFAWFLFALLSSLGFFTIPIMLYPFGVVLIWFLLSILVKDTKLSRIFLFKRIIFFTTTTAIFTIILYTPAFIRNGIKSIITSNVIKPQLWSLFITSLKETTISIWNQWNRDIPIVLVIIFLISFLISLILHKKIASHKIPIIIPVIIWCVPLIFLQRTMTYERVWLFLLPLYIILVSVGLGFILKLILSKIKRQKYLIFSCISILLSLVICFMVFNSKSVYYSLETGAFIEAEDITILLKKQLKEGDRVIGRAPTDYTLIYYFDRHNVPIGYLYSDLHSGKRAFIIVNKSYKQTINEVLDYYNLTLDGYGTPELYQKYNSIYIYKTQRMNNS